MVEDVVTIFRVVEVEDLVPLVVPDEVVECLDVKRPGIEVEGLFGGGYS